MRRWHAERDLMLRRWRHEIAAHGGHAGWRCDRFGNSWLLASVPPVVCEDSCHCFAGPGFFRKRKPFDCGNPKCALCHYEKFWIPKARANKKREAIEFERLAYE